MFASTLDHTEAFLKSICCDQCHQLSDKLQFIGSSCKHVFCWTCINAICDRKSFPLCPQCLLPVGFQHVKSAAFADQLFQSLLSLKEALAKFTVYQCDRQIMLSLIETDEQRRTVEEFCSTQKYAEIKDDVSHAAVNEQLEELLSDSTPTPVSNDILGLVSLSDNVTPLTQTKDTIVAGTSVQNDILTQQMRVYNEPGSFQFFKEPARNTFDRTVAKKRFNDSEDRLKSPGAKNSDTIQSITPTAQNSHKSPSQRYEYNLVNAAIRGSKKKLLEALKNGEDANESDNLGLTALYHAAAHNYTEICKILIENGALINAHGGELCETALHAAVRWQAIDAIEYLLSKGANRQARNLKDETPMDFIKNEEIRAVFGRISHSVQIEYSSRKLKKYSVFLSTTLPNVTLECGKLLFTHLSKYAVNLETASHLVVQAVENRTAEITIEILEAMLHGQYILTSEWLNACLQANDIVDEEMYEIITINRNNQLLATNSCSVARRNYAEMKPGLFRGCHFYFCKHKYLPYRESEIKKLVQLAGGVILGREPKAEEYVESGLRPYHVRRNENDVNELSGLFAVYMPGQSMPQRVVKQKFINLITPIWIMECIAQFTLLRPENW
ncbi:Ankyrin repeats (3 copies) family protein [Acanthocheilonema viteae]